MNYEEALREMRDEALSGSLRMMLRADAIQNEVDRMLEANRRLRALLSEARDDIREEVESRYPFKDDYPEEMRRYNRDMEIVHRINAALAATEDGKDGN